MADEKSFIRRIPGFRSGTWWKMGLAVLGYGFIALVFIGLIIPSPPADSTYAGTTTSPITPTITPTSDSRSDDMIFLDIASESTEDINNNLNLIKEALNAKDWPAMKTYSDEHILQADETISKIQTLSVTGKRIPAKEQWILVLKSSKDVAVYTGRAATEYENGRILNGDTEMYTALDKMDELNENLDKFNSMDLV